MNTESIQLLTQGFTLITPTSRLARYLQYRYAALQISVGKSAWETPDILPWNGWLQRTWELFADRHNPGQIELSPEQQRWVWQEIISQSAWANRLLQPAHTARLAIAAWSECQQWRLTGFPENLYRNEDAFAFSKWANAYQEKCRNRHWVDEGMIPEWLINTSLPITLPDKIALTGFDDLSPLQRALLEKLQTTGCEIRLLPLQKRNKSIIASGYKDSRAELKAAATWAREKLESDPAATIGIVVHNLRNQHSQLENIFTDVLVPGSVLFNTEEISRPFSISLGLPLQHYPVIDIALQILGLGRTLIPQEEFGSLLRTPFIKDAEHENQQRAKLDACLRKNGENRVSINSLQRFIKSRLIKPEEIPDNFIACCFEFSRTFQKLDKKQPASEWAKVFSALLKIFHWPGERSLNSAEYQTVAEWQDLLGKFAKLDQVTARLTYSDAMRIIRNLVMNSSFQPETPEAPVQILGMTGAAGMEFDFLRIINLHEEVWPPRADPNPFIPINLQREQNMPDSSANNKLEWARNLTQRLIDSCPEVILTYPQVEKERPLRPSPLVQLFPQSNETSHEEKTPDYAGKIFISRQTENIEDNCAPLISPGEVVSGGAGLFKDQAACPFRAFARHRLEAEGLESLDIGLNVLDRGLIVHEVMEILWKKLDSHRKLSGIEKAELDVLINDAISSIVSEYQKKFPLTFTDKFTAIEKLRLYTLVNDWLSLERIRQPFSVIESEQWHQFSFNDIEIRTRIDRIDQLADGRFVIIDYKTGSPDINAWFDERPDEPQLPLYAVNTKGEIAAIVFAKLKRGETAYIGLAAEDGLLPEVSTVDKTRIIKTIVPDWNKLFDYWHEILMRIATDFRNGNALVDPKNNNTCRYCDLHAFCRIFEKNSEINDQETEYE